MWSRHVLFQVLQWVMRAILNVMHRAQLPLSATRAAMNFGLHPALELGQRTLRSPANRHEMSGVMWGTMANAVRLGPSRVSGII